MKISLAYIVFLVMVASSCSTNQQDTIVESTAAEPADSMTTSSKDTTTLVTRDSTVKHAAIKFSVTREKP